MSENERLIKLSEASVKNAVEDRLQIAQNQGKLLYLRLNSGELIATAGETRRRIKLCPTGTADFLVIKGCKSFGVVFTELSFVTFLEIKSSTGKQSPEQKEFEQKTQAQNCDYFIIRDAGELEKILQ